MTEYTKGLVKNDIVYLFNKWNVPKDAFIKFFKGGIPIEDLEENIELMVGGQEIDSQNFNIFWKCKDGSDDGKIWEIKGNSEFAHLTSKWETEEYLEIKDCDFIEVPTIIKGHIYNRLDEDPLYKLKEGEKRIKVVDEEGNIDESKIMEIINNQLITSKNLDKRLDGRELELNDMTTDETEEHKSVLNNMIDEIKPKSKSI
mgnify:CR=1 FL=1|tara:strand:- start:322 stop:924 length:603 start_codon:yes stop_codon:yes gene_type:complete